MGYWRLHLLVILPQALRVAIPPTINQYLNLTKNSSLATVIGYPELMSTFGGTVLNQVVNHPQLEKYFDQNKEVFNEREILTANKTIIIPDRLVFEANKVTIIDYKTGQASEKYTQQLNWYAQVLRDLNYLVDKKLLIYINKEITIEEV